MSTIFRTTIKTFRDDRRLHGVEDSHHVERTGDGGDAFYEEHWELGDPDCPCGCGCEEPEPVDDGSCDPLYGRRMDSADLGEN